MCLDGLDLDASSQQQQQQYQQRSGRASAYDTRSSTAPLPLYQHSYSTDYHQSAPQTVNQPPSSMPPATGSTHSVSSTSMLPYSMPTGSQLPVRLSSESLPTSSRSDQRMVSKPAQIQSNVRQTRTSLPSQQRGLAVPANEARSTEALNGAWYTFNDDFPSHILSSEAVVGEAHGQLRVNTRPAYENVFPLKRYGSTGAFSDDFVLGSERESQKTNLPPKLLPRSSHATGSIPHLPSATSGLPERERPRPLNRSMEVLSPISGSRFGEEEDRQLLKEFRYRRLLHSPNAASSPEVSPPLRREGDLEQLLPSTPDNVEASSLTTGDGTGGKTDTTPVSPLCNSASKPGTDNESWRSLLVSKKEIFSGATASSVRQGSDPVANGRTASELSLDRGSDVSEDTIVEEQQQPVQSDPVVVSNSIGVNVEATPIEAHPSTSSSSGDVRELLENETSDSRAQHEALVVGDGTGQTDSRSGQHQGVSDKEFWNGILVVPPEIDRDRGGERKEAGSDHSPHGLSLSEGNTLVLSGENSDSVTVSPIPERLNLDIFPQALDSDSNLSGELSLMSTVPDDISSSAPRVDSAWLPMGTSSSGGGTTTTAILIPVQSSSGEETVAVSAGCGTMSPILEASQELTGTMSQQSVTQVSNSAVINAGESNQQSHARLPSLTGTVSTSSTPSVVVAVQSTLPDGTHNISTPSTASASHCSPKQQFPVKELTRFSRSPSPSQAVISTAHQQYSNVEVNVQGSPLRQARSQSSPIRSPTRPMSPLATSSLTAHGPAQHSHPELNESATGVENLQAGTQQENTSYVQGDSTASLQQGSTSGNLQGTRVQEGERLNQGGREQSAEDRSGDAGRGGSKVRYSHQRHQDPARAQNRIRLELEAMDSAISGMDSQNRQPLYPRDGSVGVSVGSQRGVASPRHSQYSQSQQQSDHHTSRSSSHSQNSRHKPPQGARNHRQGAGQSGRRSGNHPTTPPSLKKSNSTAGRSPSIPSHNKFRPITPALGAGSSRPSSAPGTREEDGRSGSRPSSTPHSRLNTPVGRGGGMLSGRQQRPLQSPGREHQHRMRPNNSSVNGRPVDPPNLQPPQVTPDSYDYLPPYSPPHSAQNNAHQQQQGAVHHNVNAASPVGDGSYPEPPPSYDEIFGELQVSSLPSQGRRDGDRHGHDHRSGNRRRRRHDRMHVSQSVSRPSSQSAAAKPLGRLSSITNIFRRHNRPSQCERDQPDIGLDDYTAQWVASYSHTPRPFNSQHTVSSSSSQRDRPSLATGGVNALPDRRAVSRGSPSFTNQSSPAPYINPPPFPLSEQVHGNPMLSGGRDSMNMSMSRLPVTSVGSNPSSPSGVRLRGQSAHDRPRPSSAYFLSDARIFQLPNTSLPSEARNQTEPPSSAGPVVDHLTPPQQHSRLITNIGPPPNPAISASCTNIASTDRPRASETSLRRQGSERLSRHRRLAYMERIGKSQASRGNHSPQQSPRAVILRSASSQNSPRGLSNSSSQRPGSGKQNAPCARSVSDNSPINQRTVQQTPPTLPEVTRDAPPMHGSSIDLATREASHPTASLTATTSPHTVTVNSAQAIDSLLEVQQNPVRNSSTNVITTSVSPLPGSAEENTNAASENIQELNDPVCSPQSHSSTNSGTNSGAGNSHSSRSAMRLRAEARRSSLIATSSSEEDLLNELSQNTSSSQGHSRPTRRRSQGSSSFVTGSQRSQDSNNQVGCHIEVREEVEGANWPQENMNDSEQQQQQDEGSGNGIGEERQVSDDQVRVDETSGPDCATEHISKLHSY